MDAQEQLRIAATQGSDRLILALEGELDMVSASQLQAALADRNLDGLRAVVLDLRGVQFLDSAGLRAIFAVRNLVRAGGRQFAVTQSSAQVQRLLGLTHLDDHLHIIDTPDAILG